MRGDCVSKSEDDVCDMGACVGVDMRTESTAQLSQTATKQRVDKFKHVSPSKLSKNEMSEPVVLGPETVTRRLQWVEQRQIFCNSPGQVR